MRPKQNKIVFLLPWRDEVPVGGYKVVYEYANRFYRDGWDVTICYPHVRGSFKQDVKNPLQRFKMRLGFFYRNLKKSYRAGEWFPLESGIKKLFVFAISDFALRDYKDAKIIATAVETAMELNAVSSVPNANKFYFIQDFEAWNVSEDAVYDSYRFSMRKITIAPWLRDRIESVGEKAELVPNGFDFGYFTLSIPIEDRSPHEIAMLYHKDERKRCEDAIKALELVKRQIPKLHVTMFGVPEPPADLPDWYTYHRQPSKALHNSIYNNAAIFVAASKAEGFGLTIGEAMICGCAIACTNNGGFSCMAIQDKTALLSPVFDTEALAKNILRLINDNELRIKLARAGNEYIRQFTWEKAFELFKSTLNC